MNRLNIILLLTALLSTEFRLGADWASMFHKRLTEDDIQNAVKNTLVFTKDGVSDFSQLLFSWNAMRPQKGHFTFLVQVRNSLTKKWSTWHRMIDWGAGVQRSYQTKGDSFSRYVHVRLEMKRYLADAFRIKIISNNGAPIHLLKGFAVTVSNKSDFKPESFSEGVDHMPSVIVKNVPRISQFALNHPDSGRICSPTSCTMLTRYLTGFMIDPIEFAEKSFDHGLGVYGSWPFNMAHAFEQCNGKNWFFNTRFNSFAELHSQLSRNIPVVVSVRGSLTGAPRPYPKGHLLIVVGWDSKKKQVICHDPACETDGKTLQRYALKDFVRAWELSHRLVYWVEPVDIA